MRSPATQPGLEAFILAGGLSTRMGRDKASLRLNGRTFLASIRAAAHGAGIPVRTLRKDFVERCGPLGGILTALKRSRAGWLLLLACDMPLVAPEFLQQLAQEALRRDRAVFCLEAGRAGFPCMLPKAMAEVIFAQHARGEYSLQALAKSLHAARWRVPARWNGCLTNLNTPAELSAFSAKMKTAGKLAPSGRPKRSDQLTSTRRRGVPSSRRGCSS